MGVLEQTLKKYWGYDSFRPSQREIIESVAEGRDTLALLPTGGGKSLTYQLPAMTRKGVCIVITPLISLMKDQVDSLRRRGISATEIHSGLSARQIDARLDNCVYGDVKFLYIAPERIASEQFTVRSRMMDVSLLAVDEAHCISKWGHDFRPSYLRISEIRHDIGDSVPVLALTASATEEVVKDIMERLAFREAKVIRGPFARPNLSYVVRMAEDAKKETAHIAESLPGSGIVYCQTRKECEQTAAFLQKSGIVCEAYHAGLPPQTRSAVQEKWMKGDVRIMAATSAFGMGIDKADVRFVIHTALPDSLESYYQEAGRAGRDGKRSYAVLLYSEKDVTRGYGLIDREFPSIERIKDIYDAVCSFLQVGTGDGCGRGFEFQLDTFCYRFRFHPTMVLSALRIIEQNGYLSYIEQAERPARLMFAVGRDALYGLRDLSERDESVMKYLMRTQTGIFTEYRPVELSAVASACGMSADDADATLKGLRKRHVMQYIPTNTTPLIYFGCERLERKNLYIAPETYTERQAIAERRFDAMVSYARSSECRSLYIARYFGNAEDSECGVCDVCLEKRKK